MVLSLKKFPIFIENVATLQEELWNTEVLLEFYIDSIKESLKNPNYDILFYVEDNNVLGYVQILLSRSYDEIHMDKPVLFIDGLYVSKYHRHKGIATELLNMSEKKAKDLGLFYIASSYMSNNINSENLHKKLGFKETSKTINVIKEIFYN